ncbi:GIY-YIG nuclease family protein [archaeon]|nr:GIY-YIG nuclease family protein [archaeon]MBT4397117.1 GIY-YIG nuclease family protein [archaeon]MBT4441577.1 GIY-YIG nuclease family protein [archaeon]
MMRGRTISIYIPDANPRSIKVCDTKDGVVKALFIPRNKIIDAIKRKELQDPGIYFLIGENNEVGKPRVYIGEAEVLLTRIKQHNSSKDFWNSVICFVSEKKNINKAHIKYLENYACNQAKKINKCELENNINPTQSSLTEQDEDFVLSFFEDIKLLIATLGYPIFEETKKDQSKILICKGKEAYATGEYSEDGFVVFKGSKSNLEESKGIGSWVSNIRKNLIEKKILKQEGNVFVFTEDYTFSSPSASAAVVLARSANGWTEWKDKKGKSIDETIRKNKN